MRGLEIVDVKDLTQLSYTEAVVTILLLMSVTGRDTRQRGLQAERAPP